MRKATFRFLALISYLTLVGCGTDDAPNMPPSSLPSVISVVDSADSTNPAIMTVNIQLQSEISENHTEVSTPDGAVLASMDIPGGKNTITFQMNSSDVSQVFIITQKQPLVGIPDVCFATGRPQRGRLETTSTCGPDETNAYLLAKASLLPDEDINRMVSRINDLKSAHSDPGVVIWSSIAATVRRLVEVALGAEPGSGSAALHQCVQIVGDLFNTFVYSGKLTVIDIEEKFNDAIRLPKKPVLAGSRNYVTPTVTSSGGVVGPIPKSTATLADDLKEFYEDGVPIVLQTLRLGTVEDIKFDGTEIVFSPLPIAKAYLISVDGTNLVSYDAHVPLPRRPHKVTVTPFTARGLLTTSYQEFNNAE